MVRHNPHPSQREKKPGQSAISRLSLKSTIIVRHGSVIARILTFAKHSTIIVWHGSVIARILTFAKHSCPSSLSKGPGTGFCLCGLLAANDLVERGQL